MPIDDVTLEEILRERDDDKHAIAEMREHIQKMKADYAEIVAVNATLERRVVELASIREYLKELAVLHRDCRDLVDKIQTFFDKHPIDAGKLEPTVADLFRKLRASAPTIAARLALLGQG